MLSVQPCIASRAPSWQPCFDPWPTKASLRSGACTSIRPISLLDVNHHCTSAGPNQSYWLWPCKASMQICQIRHRLCRSNGTRLAWILLGSAVWVACSPVLWFHSMLGLVPNGAAKPSQPHPSLLLAGSKVPNGTGSADQMATRLAWILLVFCRFGCVPTGTMVPLDAWAQWCCQAFAAPSIFAFSGFEGAKRHRLCRPTGNPFGLNLAMVPLDA